MSICVRVLGEHKPRIVVLPSWGLLLHYVKVWETVVEPDKVTVVVEEPVKAGAWIVHSLWIVPEHMPWETMVHE